MNIVTIKAKYIPNNIADKYDLVPQKHNNDNEWYKIVLMEHVEVDSLNHLIDDLKKNCVI